MQSTESNEPKVALVPLGSSVTSGAEAILLPTGLKRRRGREEAEDEKRARQKTTEQNSFDSPLLNLPAEIRRLIFKHVLSGQYIHVEQLHVGLVDRYEKKEVRFGHAGLWNSICHTNHEEAEAYSCFLDAKMGDDAAPTPFGKTKEGEDIGHGYHVDSFSYRHRNCAVEPSIYRFNVTLEEWKARDYLSLSCLRTCKLIYKEMRIVPYAESVFLFRSPVAFQAFATSCRPEQFRALRHISICVAVGSAPFSQARNRLWASIIWDYNLSNSIRNLRLLDITLELYFPKDIFTHRFQNTKPCLEDCIDEINLSDEKQPNNLTDWVQGLSRLSRQVPSFRVIVSDDPESMWGLLGMPVAMRDWRLSDVGQWMAQRNRQCLTVEGKQKLARELEVRLQDTADAH